MKIIVTGTTGFVGTNLKEYLLKKSKGIVDLKTRFEPYQIFDIIGYGVIHLAGKAHDLKKVSHPHEYYEANFELTKQLFDGFLASEARVFIFMSTVKAVADEVIEILNEEEIPNPKTHYGIAKHMAEEYILSKKLPKEKRVYILRPCMIHGPGNKGNLNLLYQFVVKGLPWPLGAFHNQRSFCSIDNVCFVINQILENETIPSGIYNLADDEALSTNELMELIATTINKKANVFYISKKLITVISRLGDTLRFPLNTERLNKLTENFIVSNAKIKNTLQIEKFPTSTKEGLIKTINSFI